jgi:hypothetical protein
MPRRAASHTKSIINRTWESGGSVGGNSKTGVVYFSNHPNISRGHFSNRTNTGKCCINAVEDTTTNTNAEPDVGDAETEDVTDVIPTIPTPGYGPATTWSTTVTNNAGASITYHSSGAITFSGDTLELHHQLVNS